MSFHRPRAAQARRLCLGLCAAAALYLGCGARPPAARIVFLGVDGLSWKVIGPLLDRGELPHLRRLMTEGAYMPEFGTLAVTDSPVVWTTVATGRAPEDHGIDGYVERLPNGKVIPISGNARRAKAIWEVATERGVSVGLIGWWASWPAEEIDAYVVTDHANPAFSSFLHQDQRYWTADPAMLAALERDYHPATLQPLLAPHWIARESFPYDELESRSGLSEQQMSLLRGAPWNSRSPYSLLKTFYAVDRAFFGIARQLHRELPTDLLMLYLRGPDPVQHYAWNLVEPERYAVQPPHLERDRGLVEGIYRYVDTFVGDLLADLGSETWLIVASDHGAEAPAGADDPGWRGRPGAHTPAARGVLFIHGPDVRPGVVLDSADPADLMPTLAWLLGLPLSQELEGRVLRQAFDAEFAARRPERLVASYGPREGGVGTISPADEALLESLRALGYLD